MHCINNLCNIYIIIATVYYIAVFLNIIYLNSWIRNVVILIVGHKSRSCIEIDTVVRNFHRKRSNLVDVLMYTRHHFILYTTVFARRGIYLTGEKYVVWFFYMLGSFLWGECWRITVERIWEKVAMFADNKDDNNDDETRLSREHDMSCSVVAL